MRRRTFLSASIGMVSACAGCLGVRFGSPDFTDDAEDFRQFQGDARNSGVVDGRAPTSGARHWRVKRGKFGTDEGRIDGIAVVDDIVLVGKGGLTTRGGGIYALDANDGSERWSSEPAGGMPACTDDTAFIGWNGRNGGGMRALDLVDGSKLWQTNLGAYITSAPTLADGSLFVSVLQETEPGGGAIVSLDPSDGSERWDFQTAQWAATPGVANETVYVAGGNEGVVYALEAETGDKVWETSMPDWMRLPPTILDDTIYVPSGFADHVFALDAKDGAERWRFEANCKGSVAATTDSIYVPTYSGIIALDTGGKRKWAEDLGERQDPNFEGYAPVLADDTLVVSGKNAVSLDLTDRSKHWEQQVAEGIDGDVIVTSTSCSPAVSGGVAFIGTAAGDVYAIGK